MMSIKRLSRAISRPTTRGMRMFASSSGNGGSVGVADDLTSFNFAQAQIGRVLTIPYELSIDESWRTLWHSAFYEHDRLYTSSKRAQNTFDLANTPMPYSLMLFLTGSMTHVDQKHTVLDVGVTNAVYEEAVFAGDTLSKVFTIVGLRHTSEGRRSLVDIRCELFNQHGTRVFSLDKQTLYPEPVPVQNTSRAPGTRTAQRASAFRKHIMDRAHKIGGDHVQPVHVGQTLLHGLSRPLMLSQTMALSSLFRMTHPLIFNHHRYNPHELVVPWALVSALSSASAARSFYDVLHETVDSGVYYNRVSPVDTVGAVSYVVDVVDVDTGGLQEVEVNTFGVKNIDMPTELENVSLPLDLLSNPPKKLSSVEDICKRECPELSGKIVSCFQRKLLRASGRTGEIHFLL